MTDTAIPSPAGSATLVQHARRLRDFGLLQPISGFSDLVTALRNYEASPSGETSQEYENLQLALSKASAGFEPETLSALLRNELKLPSDPLTKVKEGSFTMSFTVVLGFIFLFASLYFTKLTIEGVGLVSKINTIMAVDFQAKTDALVRMIRPFSQDGGVSIEALQEVQEASGIEENADPALAAVFGTLNELQYYFSYADALMEQMRPLNGKFRYDFVAEIREMFSEPAITNVVQTQGTTAPTVANENAGLKTVSNSVIDTYPALDEYDRLVSSIRHVVYNASSASTMTPQYVSMIYSLERDQLMTNVEITNKWTLPVLYGALGAVLYVLARHFNPFVASLSLPRIMLRITFAMFVAVTISMLLIPANVLTSNIVSTPSGIFLLCFVAGYSTDTFIRFLAKLNSYFVMPTTRNEAR